MRIFASSIEFIRVTYKRGFNIPSPAIEWTRYDKSRVNSRFESASLASIFPLNFHDSTIGQRLESAISKVALIPLCKVFSNGVSQSWRKKFSFSKPPSNGYRSIGLTTLKSRLQFPPTLTLLIRHINN